jgi:hypothetical protein
MFNSKLLKVSLLLFVLGCQVKNHSAGIKTPTKDDENDTFFIKLRYEHSSDLVTHLDGIELYNIYEVRSNDGKNRKVKVALLDRELNRVGIVLAESGVPVEGARGYDTRGAAFVTMDWFKKALEQAKNP